MVLKDLTNQRFGRLVVIRQAENAVSQNGQSIVQWLCQCDCGNLKIVPARDLRSGHVRSCGCLALECRTKHGEYNTRLYSIWVSMIQRCNNPNHKHYNYYGGRGIQICEEWYNYINFRNWAYNNGYYDNCSLELDRIDSNGNYNMYNCRWITHREQMNNRRNNLYIEYFNEIHSLAEWCWIFNLPYKVINTRIYRGWDFWKAISTPLPAHYYNDCYDYDYSNEYYEDPYEYDNYDNCYMY